MVWYCQKGADTCLLDCWERSVVLVLTGMRMQGYIKVPIPYSILIMMIGIAQVITQSLCVAAPAVSPG